MRLSAEWMALPLILVLCAVSPAWSGEADSAPQAAMPTVPDFSLRDCYGAMRKLSDLQGDRLTVVAFLGTECPLARLYGPRLEKLHERFADQGVAVIAINSNVQDSMTELLAYVQRHRLTFPMLKDPGNRVADQFDAHRTPEVFVLDTQRMVRYRGRIDDQYLVGGQVRPEPTREDLAVAVEELLAGKPVSTPVTEAAGCLIGRVRRTAATGSITWTKDIAPIFHQRCVECHRDGQIAPFTLGSYDDVQGWGETIVEVIRENRMPPWPANPKYGHFSNDARLSDQQKTLITQWVQNGMPEGDPADLPPAPKFAEGWRIPEPEQIVYMSDEPFDVPAEGVVDYQYFEVDPGFTEDKYVWAAEARPGNVEVVHHIIVYIKPPGSGKKRVGFGSVDGYAPGNPPTRYPEGMAMLVPAGSKFVFEMHYTPNGRAQQDRSYVGLRFRKKEDVKKRVYGNLAINRKFSIPPGAADHEVVATRRIRIDQQLLSLMPHMHLRGKSFRYEAVYPDGTREILLDVPRYDFNWQLTYELTQPKLLPRGTEIICTARYDNSADNPVNPDPEKAVGWGQQSWDEMMIGFFDVVPAKE